MYKLPIPINQPIRVTGLEQYLPGLERAGIHAVVRPFMSEALFSIYADHGRYLAKLHEIAASMARRLRDVLQQGNMKQFFYTKKHSCLDLLG